jgi:protein-tyrosine-phosphatase
MSTMRILFVCKDHGIRSRLAEALAKQVLADAAVVHSAGVTPAKLSPSAVTWLAQAGASADAGRALQGLDLGAFDLAVAVGSERDVAQALPSVLKHVTWPLMEPNDPPAGNAELQARFVELKRALEAHVKSLVKMKRGAA